MTKFGSWLSNASTGVGEQWVQANPQAWMVAGENLYGMGWFTMPFAGNLTLDLYANCDWPGDNCPSLWLSVWTGSTPGPSSTADMRISHTGINVFRGGGELRSHAWWANLTAGAGVYAYARIYCTQGGNTVAIRYIGGLYRPTPL